MSYRQSSLTTDTIPYPFEITSLGADANPTTYTVEFAFMSDDKTKPAGTDWHAGTWETWTVTGVGTPYRAVTPSIGPAGIVTTLTARPQPYFPWLRVTVSGTVVLVMQLGALHID